MFYLYFKLREDVGDFFISWYIDFVFYDFFIFYYYGKMFDWVFLGFVCSRYYV